MPVNLVLVAEGEEEIGSPHIGQIVRQPEVQAALAGTVGVFMPSASQTPDGLSTVRLGAKGVIDVQLTASGAHAPDEHFVVESDNPNIAGWDGAGLSCVECLYERAK